MRNILLPLFFFTQIIFSQTIEISGIVKDAHGPLPGANVIAKGTSIGTQTNFEGFFKLLVPDSTQTIIISFLGYKSLEIDISTNINNKEYLLEEDLLFLEEISYHGCYFYPRYVGVYYFAGLNHSKYGFHIEYFDPYLFSLPFIPVFNFGYQTNNLNNKQIQGEIYFKDLLYFNSIKFGARAIFSKLEIDNTFELETLKVEADFSKRLIFGRYTTLIAGAGKATIKNSVNEFSNIGYTFGFAQGLPLNINAIIKTTNWNNKWQLQTEMYFTFKNIKAFYRFNRIENYREHNLGLGYTFNF